MYSFFFTRSDLLCPYSFLPFLYTVMQQRAETSTTQLCQLPPSCLNSKTETKWQWFLHCKPGYCRSETSHLSYLLRGSISGHKFSIAWISCRIRHPKREMKWTTQFLKTVASFLIFSNKSQHLTISGDVQCKSQMAARKKKAGDPFYSLLLLLPLLTFLPIFSLTPWELYLHLW